MSTNINFLTAFINQLDEFLAYLHLTIKIHDAGMVRQAVLVLRRMNPRLVLDEFMDFALELDPISNRPYYQKIINRDETFFTKKLDIHSTIRGDSEDDRQSNILTAIALRKRWNSLSKPIKYKIFTVLNRLIKLAALSNENKYKNVLLFIKQRLQEQKTA